MLYKIVFKDNAIYKGGDSLMDSKWRGIPEDKEIASLIYSLPDGNLITLRDYEAYNHLIEATQNIYGSACTRQVIRAIYLMGLKGNIVTSYRISLFEEKNSKYKLGDITRREYILGKEFRGQPTSGWKKGIK